MRTVDLGAKLEQTLSPADLRLSGAALYRRLRSRLGGEAALADPAFSRIGKDGRTLIVRLRPTHSDDQGDPYFLWASSGHVRALGLPTGDSSDALVRSWRRRSNRIVVAFDQAMGNTEWPRVVVLGWRGGAWRIAAQRSAGAETHAVRFVGAGIDRLVVSTRSYDFRCLSQPHAGPLLIRDDLWKVRERNIADAASNLRRTPLYDFDRFCDAVLRGNGRTARALCAPRLYARAARIVRSSRKANGHLTVINPGSVEYDLGRWVGFWGAGTGEPRVFFRLDRRGAGWRIAALRPQSEFRKP